MRPKALVIRIGALGDAITVTPLLRFLRRDGYHVTVNCKKRGSEIYQNNPHVDDIILHDESIPNEGLEEHWNYLSVGFDKVINLSESIEKGLMATEGSEEFDLPKDERHRRYNYNYYDRTLEIGGYDIKGLNGEIYFSQFERMQIREFKKKHEGKYKVVWALSGSSHHKSYPYAEGVATEFMEKHPDAVMFTMGDMVTELIQWSHPRVFNYADKISVRRALMIISASDLVISPESFACNAAGCFDVPKIIFLSHSTDENLTKYFKNCISLAADVECWPCHQIHYSMGTCHVHTVTGTPLCSASIKPETVLRAMETQYGRKHGILHREREPGLVCA